MNATEFFNLPINRKTVSKLRQRDIFYKNPAFYSVFISGINSYLSLPKCIKSFATKPTMKSIYNSLVEIKKAGYRKELILEF